MWYPVLYFIFAIWVFFDSKKRKGTPWISAIVVLLFGPLMLPYYFATRNLKEGEVREGGMGWNWMKNLIIFWTITCIIWGIAAMSEVSKTMEATQKVTDQLGTAIGAGIGLGLIFVIWFVITLVALVIGLLLKKSSIVEKGPTGALAVEASTRQATNS